MSLRIAFDVDGVLADMDREVAPHRSTRRFWRHVETTENFWETLEEAEPGAVAKLARATSSHRWEVIFLTRRPRSAGETAQIQTQRWLRKKGFPLPSVYVVQGSRGRIAAALNLDHVIDDRIENCLDVVSDSKARPILFWRATNRGLPEAAGRIGIGTVSSIDECLALLKKADAPHERRAGTLGRVKRLRYRSPRSTNSKS